MATIAKNFRVKNGLIVEGTTATVNGNDVLTKKQDDQDYIIGLIGGSASSEATPDTVVLRDENGDFSANEITSNLVGNVDGDLTGNVTGQVSDISNHDTDDLTEGAANLYFTDQRVKDVLVGSTQSNISITEVEGDLVITAENGVDDSTTDDLDEGVTNLYFTNQRAMDAVQSSYESYANQAEADAITSANSYTDGRETAITTAYQSYADTAESDAVTSANSYTDGRETAITTAYQSYADTAEADAKSYTDDLIGDVTVDGTGGNTVTDRIASAVSSLVDSSPETLDTLNELAAALGDDPNFATTVSNSIGEKVSKAGDTMTGDLSLAQDPTQNLHAATKQYVDTAESDAVTSANSYTDGRETAITTAYQSYADTAEADAVTSANSYTDGRETAITTAYQSYADTAEADAVTSANSYTDGRETAITTAYQSYADQAETDANSFTTDAINALDTDDIEEGATNQYFTDERAKTSAADLLTGATLENITITGTGAGLTITAENGVADSDTDDLVEGTSNLYFTDQRAVDALEAVTPVFTEIDVNSIALNIAATVDVAVQNTTGTVYSFDSGTYTSAKFLVKADTGTHTEITEVLVTLDSSSNIAITEYAIVNTGGSLVNITAVMNDADVELQATVVNDNTTVRVYGTLIV
jgi:adhesin YadB/C